MPTKNIGRLEPQAMTEQNVTNESPALDHGIAIIGMACRFPGSKDARQFWDNLRNGVESISFFNDRELEAAGLDPEIWKRPDYIRANGFLENIDLFDAQFFGFNPREAAMMDPQHRFILEVAWEALEDAGYDSSSYPGAIGVFCGSGKHNYFPNNLAGNRELLETAGELQSYLGNDKDFIPTRISYKLNLRGPSINVQTACSTSLVAIHLASQSLATGECDIALAGGVSITELTKGGYFYVEEGTYSPDGHCRAFDADARGMVGGNGVGVVVLKRLSDAVRDADSLRAVIRGSAVNNDGSVKIGYTAPGIDGQAAVISEALGVADVHPDTISYVETHGTATTLGDPIEIAALTQAYRAYTSEKQYCAIGSLKTNIGHTNAAAGVGGVIKATLALQHGMLPPSLHFKRPNPKLDLENSPFFVNAQLTEWRRSGGPRRAGVSAFGMGGTNAHLILEEAPESAPSSESRPYQLLALSARSASALERSTDNLAEYLRQQPEVNLADVAYTLQVGRRRFAHRRVLVCSNTGEAVEAFGARSGQSASMLTKVEELQDRPVAFMFPGQGAQYANMGAELYQLEPVFRRHVDYCCEFLKPHLGFDLREALYPQPDMTDAATARLKDTAVTQPALFVIEYALAQLFLSWGVRPQSMIGHSVGEYTAACLAGVFSPEDAMVLIAARGRLMHDLPGGGMVAVAMPPAEVQPLLFDSLSLAAVNTPSLCVVSGTYEDIEKFESKLNASGVTCQHLHTSHAFHSRMMDPILERFTQLVGSIHLNAPKIPYISNVTGTWITAGEATDPRYWATHLRTTVRFADGVRELLKERDRLLLEVGPGRTLSTSADRHPDKKSHAIVGSMRHPNAKESDFAFALRSLGQLWAAGVDIDWRRFYENERRYRIPLPTYPFERQRYWVEPQRSTTLRKKTGIQNWFYVPSWKRSVRPAISPGPAAETRRWLVVGDDAAEVIRKQLEQLGEDVVTVRGAAEASDYKSLLNGLGPDRLPNRVVHALGGENGLYSMVSLTQALGEIQTHDSVEIAVVTVGAHEVTGSEFIKPENSLVLGACAVIPYEYPNIGCRSIDVESADQAAKAIHEVLAQSPDRFVAYRGRHRWVRAFEPAPLEATRPEVSVLSRNGVYLITGGLGGIGRTIAEYLAQAVQAKLVLIGRSEITSSGIRAVQAMEEKGAEVLVIRADVTDRNQMARALEQIRSRFGRIHGVIHSAGIADGGIIQLSTRQALHDVIAPKVHGTMVLDDLLKDDRLDFFILCSSLASVLGGGGSVAYCGANSFLDAFAHYRSKQSRTIAVNWDTWQDVGMAAETPVPAALQRERDEALKQGMSPKEGVEAFIRVLSAELPQVLISTRDLEARLDQRPGPASKAEPNETTHEEQPLESVPLPVGENYLAPRTTLEKTVADVWSKLFGVDAVGIHDDFFQLGGHSLLATQLLNKLRKMYPNVDLSLRILFDQPTVAGLAAVIESATASTPPVDGRERTGLALQDYLRKEIAKALRTEPHKIDANSEIPRVQMESIAADLIWSLKRDYDFRVFPHEILKRGSVTALAGFIESELNDRSAPQRGHHPLPSIRVATPSRANVAPSKKNPPAIFLLSAPRSGSTLLRLMMARHPALFCPPELGLMGYDTAGAWAGKHLSVFATEGVTQALSVLMNIDLKKAKAIVDGFIEKDSPIPDIYRFLQERAGSRTLLDKTPGYALSKETLLRAEDIFDRPRYIHLIRHPYAVIESFVRNRMEKLFVEEKVDPYAFAEQVWMTCNSNIQELTRQAGPERCRLVAYEELVRSPESVMRDMCAFLSIPFESAVLEPYQNNRMLAGPGDPDVSTHDTIEAAGAERWRSIALPHSLRDEAQRLASGFGYELPAEAALRSNGQILPNIDHLSDQEVDSLLKGMLAQADTE
jgi:acyl transferase domain-containing protein